MFDTCTTKYGLLSFWGKLDMKNLWDKSNQRDSSF